MCRTGFFGSKAGSFTSFFSRTGHSPTSSPMGEASIHGGGAGNFRQVRLSITVDLLNSFLLLETQHVHWSSQNSNMPGERQVDGTAVDCFKCQQISATRYVAPK